MPSSPVLNTYKNLVMTSVILLLSLLPYHCYLQNPGENIQGKEVIFFFFLSGFTCMPRVQTKTLSPSPTC